MYKIIYERDKCIGCGTCATICPSYWEMGSDSRASLKDSTEENDNFVKEIEELSCNGEAEQSCPVQCIHIKDYQNEGKQ